MHSARDTIPRLAVVGHTNVGKTSLMRTLMRDASFGEVAASAATTRQVEQAALLINGRPAIELFDTPGLEDAGTLIERLEPGAGERHSGPERIAAFLNSPPAHERYEQEARVLGQMLASDAALYVIDAREPVLGKYQDELAILTLCARPILPVLNFTADPDQRAPEWRAALARVGLHAVAEFDTVVFSAEAEAHLWRRLATLLESHAEVLARLIDDRAERARLQHRAAYAMLASMLIDCAAARRFAARGQAEAIKREQARLREAVQQREHRLAKELLELFRFDPEIHHDLPLPVDSAAWRRGIFDPNSLVAFRRGGGSGAAAGAATGAAVDLAVGGLSLGTATLVGALAGGGAGTLWQFRRELSDRLRQRVRLMIDAPALGHIAARARALIGALEQRGHAAQASLQLGDRLPKPWPGPGLPEALQRAREHAEFSTLNANAFEEAELRDRLVAELTEQLLA